MDKNYVNYIVYKNYNKQANLFMCESENKNL